MQPVRLLAAVIAKNAVGSSWRKTVDSREWSRVSLQEKQYVQAHAVHSLLGDPSDKVAVQLALLVANIARCDHKQGRCIYGVIVMQAHAVHSLLGDPSDKVAVQLALLVASIAKCDARVIA